MTEHDGGSRCSYCWHPPYEVMGQAGLHNDGCPVVDPAQMPEWQAGFERGWNWVEDDGYRGLWQLRRYSQAFQFGFRAGKEEIDALADEAAQRAVWGDEY